MRIGVLTSLYPSPPRPFEGLFAEQRWRGMAQRGHAVHVVQPVPLAPWPLVRGARGEYRAMPRRELRQGIGIARPRYVHLPGAALANARRFARAGLAQLLAGERPAVVVADYAWPASAAAPELGRLGVPCLVSGRGSDVLEVAREAGLGEPLAAHLRAAGHWCGVSEDLVRELDRLGGRAGQGVLVPNGIDLARFRPGPREDARRTLGLAPGGPLVLVVGHLIERKDPLLALAAFVHGATPDARLVFLGRGPLAAELRAAAQRAGAAERVSLRGEVPPEELAEWYRASDLLLLTSRREGRPNVVLEALASGRAVLATEAGGTAELLAARPELLARTRDPAALGRALAALLARPPEPAELRALVAHLTWERSFTALEGALEAAIRGATR